MDRTSGRTMLVIAALVLGAACATSAAGAVRSVAPTGTGTACTVAAPCGVATGIEDAAPGDEVVIASGTYGAPGSPVAVGLTFPATGPVTVRGAEVGPNRPVIHLNTQINVRGTGSLLQDVAIQADDNQAIDIAAGASADRVVGRTTSAQGGDDACILRGAATLTNSLCIQAGVNTSVAAASSQVGAGAAFRGDTVVGSDLGLFVNFPATIANSVLVGTGDVDLVRNDEGVTAYANDFFADFTDNFPGTPSTITGRLTSGLAFRDQPGGDFRQSASSSTINAGAAGESAGLLDLNGNLRTVGAAPDMGAFEHVPAPTVTAGDVTAVTGTTATVRPLLDTAGGRTTLRVEYGTTSGSLPVKVELTVPASAGGAAPVPVALTGLASGQRFFYRAVATSDGGTATSLEGSFTTISPLVPAPRDRTKPRVVIRLPAVLRIAATGLLVRRVTCNEPCRLRVVARLGVRGGTPVRFRALANAPITVRLRPVRNNRRATDVRLVLTRARGAALTALAAGKRVVIRIEVRATDPAGNVRTTTKFVAVRRG